MFEPSFPLEDPKEHLKEHLTVTSSARGEHHRPRHILDELLARITLLFLIYAVVNVSYQQAYLQYLGFRVGLWQITLTPPLAIDVVVGGYVVVLWLFIIWLPRRWFDTLAGLFSLGTWRDKETWMMRISGFLFPFLLLLISVLWLLKDQLKEDPLTPMYFATLPALEFASWYPVTGLFTGLLVVFVLFSLRYRHIRRLGIWQTLPSYRAQMYFFLNVVLPGGILVSMATLFLIWPAFYGRERARWDIWHMANDGIQRVLAADNLPLCQRDLTSTAENDRFVSLHLVGHLNNTYVFLRVERPTSSSASRSGELTFDVCVEDMLKAVEFSGRHGIQMGQSQ